MLLFISILPILIGGFLMKDEPIIIDTSTVEVFDLERYTGLWYEIARFDNRFERGLECVTAEYTLNDGGKSEVVNRGYNAEREEWQQSRGKARRTDNEGQLQVSFFLWFYSDYNILELSDDYSWALVGSSKPDYLWILSRTPVLDDSTLDRILHLARQRGYPTENLIYPKPLMSP